MKYTLDIKTLNILRHILYVAENQSKEVQFCFRKGKKQFYINPKEEIFVTFELNDPIKFEYPIKNLDDFLAVATNNAKVLSPYIIDSEKNKVNKDRLFLPTNEHIKDFEGKSVVQVTDFTKEDYLQIKKHNKFKYLNIIGEDKKFKLRLQNHYESYWFDDGNKKILTLGKASRKFRYILKRDRIILLPNTYKLICKKGGIVRFQYKHLNYYFKTENDWHGITVKEWVSAKSKVKDKHLIALYKSKGYM